ncbi:helix-turn-helix transcriptional regulator [Tsukamurella paurometabola]|uniref:Helix-turn-helix domain-containing protein n=1 Tax=Tsukamurella paurometabola TaxID=2061 RepID=A0A3P8K429_TSUPA|nr:helix-turn-helix domain-containing protein [Tsukamurella paurometabola]UEA83014.1 helix-turn-helix domain-containing protein [Tsukamurella paurometabola]VDR40099.1 Uncharacterised protein [Tsukamurella paurometabola]
MTYPTTTRTLLSAKQLEERYGISVNTWRYWRQCGTGPAAVVLGKRKILYDVDVVERWISARSEQETA